ncbi:hypothetical protein EG327_002983 [Venturia inaequalis]|uniref:Uncharacterized protein n=1 Tax=Venturia inaequalis TaxID=5025 RepID=A0A8H3ZAK0_VENIN|nr:hypothetical protein EG327_002983 [Venturia inaequalis]
MDQIQIFDCPRLDGVYTQEFIDNFNRLAIAVRNPLSRKKVVCNGDFLKLPQELKDMIYVYVVDWNGVINTIKMAAFRPQVMVGQTHNSVPNLLICGNKQMSSEAIKAYRRTPLVLDDTELGDLLVGRFDSIISTRTMRHLQHVKFVFDENASSERMNPYKEIIRAIADDNSDLLTLTFVFMDSEELVDPTANFLYSGWTNWDGYDVSTMLEDIWFSFIEPRIMAMCTECKKEYKWEEDGDLIFGCGGLGLEGFGYHDNI